MPPNEEDRRPHGSGDQPATKHSGFKVTRINGQTALVVLLPIPDDAPAEVREGLARRNIVNTGGTCPCGAVMRLPNRAARRAGVVDVSAAHEDDCPATDENIRPALRRWRR
jgi:hypothetical protein